MRPFSLVLVLLTWFSPCFGDDLKDRLTTGLLACVDLQDKFESSHFCTGEIWASAQEQGSGNKDLVYLTKSRFFTVGGIDQDTGEKFLFTGRTSNNLLDHGPEFRVWVVWLQVGAKQYWFRGVLGDRKVELTDLAETKETPTEPIFTHHVFIRPLAVTNQWTSGLANTT